MAKKYRVRLTEEEQQELKSLVSRGRAAAYKQTHARILLLSDENQAGGAMKDQDIARALTVGSATVERVRRRCVEEGPEAALERRQQVNRRRKKVDGKAEAHLIALACSQPPEGRVSWTLQLMADQMVQREIVESISRETVRRSGQRRLTGDSSPGMKLHGKACRLERVLVHPTGGYYAEFVRSHGPGACWTVYHR